MKTLIFVYSSCSKKMYDKLHEGATYMVSPQDQKYYSIMLAGLNNFYEQIVCLSSRPINRKLTNKIFWKREKEVENNISYNYFCLIDLPVIKHLFIFFECFFACLILSKKNKDIDIIVNVLNLSSAYAVLLVAYIKKIKVTGIVTDPLYDEHNAFMFKIRKFLMGKIDYAVFLTEQMTDLPYFKGKKSITIEGQVDSAMEHALNKLEDKKRPKVLLYAGAIEKQYGLENLVNAFIKADVKDWILGIFGNGSFVNELIEIGKKNNKICYYGTKLNHEIVEEEIKASLLVNPRFTNEEYTKYSFPSKNMEYMASGTPILTTNLPGMPKEYHEYIYLFDDESVNGMKNTLQKILNLPIEELHYKGDKAKKFVMEKKNNIEQSKKIYDFLRKVENEK